MFTVQTTVYVTSNRNLKKYLTPSWFLPFLYICHNQMFQVIKQILLYDKDNSIKHKIKFLNDDFQPYMALGIKIHQLTKFNW